MEKKFQQMARETWEAFLNALFPPFCVSCGVRSLDTRTADGWWCRACRASVDVSRVRFRYDGFERLDVTGLYHDPRLRAAIHALKYKGLTAIRPALVAYLRTRVHRDERQRIANYHIVIQPLPTDPRRVRERGFDQATFIAECLVEAIGIETPILHLLDRYRGSGIAQATIESPELRAANIRGVFLLRTRGDVGSLTVPRNILLIDDVITTGATMKEAARVLRDAGAQTISGFALALGV